MLLKKGALSAIIIAFCCIVSLQRGYTASPSKTFENPLGNGQDPWIVKHEGKYYTCASAKGGLVVTESRLMTKVERSEVVWRPPANSWNSYSIWAPELHPINGKWYIYYAAGSHKGAPYYDQRTGVLEGDSPFGPYQDKGMVYTGDDPEQKRDNIWAIDMTVLQHKGELYAIWSGWPYQIDIEGRGPNQNTYIAKMDNPWTLGPRVLLSTPSEDWEMGEQFELQEGAQVLQNNKDVFILYSTRGSWTIHYKLGQLRLCSYDSDPLDPASWEKSGPVFEGTPTVFGVGHSSYTTSPDDTEHWIYYHTKKEKKPGWPREVLLQKFTFDDDGNPNFGTPAGQGTMIRPSGELKIEKQILKEKKRENRKKN